MQGHLRHLTPQPLLGLTAVVLAFACLARFWMSYGTGVVDLPVAALTLCLIAAALAAHAFPIHIRHNTKINVSSVPLYLLVVLLPVSLGATSAGLSVLADGLIFRSRRGNHLSDIATEAGRWALLGAGAALVAHMPQLRHTLPALPLLAAAGTLWSGDILTSPLVLAPMSGEPMRAVLVTVAREAGPAEGLQYLVGLLGALAAAYELWALMLLFVPVAIVYVASKRAKEVHDRTRRLLEHLADWVDVRDPYTGGHSRRVADLAESILRELRMRGPEVDLIVQAARLHDIGKISLPDHVLNKTSVLTEGEETLMRTHPAQGAELLAGYPSFGRGVDMVLHHHEQWDGAGYPHGLKGTRIPLGARIMAVADSFDAMTTDRPYRQALSVEQAASILRQGCGRQWDPAIVDALLRGISQQLGEPVPDPQPDLSGSLGEAVFA